MNRESRRSSWTVLCARLTLAAFAATLPGPAAWAAAATAVERVAPLSTASGSPLSFVSSPASLSPAVQAPIAMPPAALSEPAANVGALETSAIPNAAEPAAASVQAASLDAARSSPAADVRSLAGLAAGAAPIDAPASMAHLNHVFDLSAADGADKGGENAPAPASGASAPAAQAPASGNELPAPSHAPFVTFDQTIFPGMGISVPAEDNPELGMMALQGQLIYIANPPLASESDKTVQHARTGVLAKLKLQTGETPMIMVMAQREARLAGPVVDGVAPLEYPPLVRNAGAERMLYNTIHQVGHYLEDDQEDQPILSIMHAERPFDVTANALSMNLDLPSDLKKSLLDSLSIPARFMAVLEHVKKKALEKAKKSADPKDAAMAAMADAAQEQASDIDAVQQKYEEKKGDIPGDARQVIEREIRRIKAMQPMDSERHTALDYVQLLTDLPWKTKTDEKNDLAYARQVLDEDHFGLEEVKEQILEHLAVRKASGSTKGMILALDGPPGVGKTSLGKSIARALNRKFERLALGGVNEPSELRGHRRTFRGAAPGKILEVARRLGVNNFVLQIDEAEKMGRGEHGNPEDALLEILDPEQNTAFRDHYADVGFDLSNVIFIVTTNELEKLSRPLRDRLDVIRISGYTENEKVEIAKRKLVDRQLAENGFKPGDVSFSDAALRAIIQGYTAESGVRGLERKIGKILRKLQSRIQGAADGPVIKEIEPEHLTDLMGKARKDRGDLAQSNDVGVASGMYWSESGGGVLLIETTALPKGTADGPLVTGSLKEVMTESANIARRNAIQWALAHGVSARAIAAYDVSVHVPEGATPKDGPSAGITMFTAFASRYTGIPVRKGVAMTGEITLTGKVWPIGGLKEKSLGAMRLGYKEIIISEDNRPDYDELPQEVKNGLKFHFVTTKEQVAEIALEKGQANPLPEIASATAPAARPDGLLKRFVRTIW